MGDATATRGRALRAPARWRFTVAAAVASLVVTACVPSPPPDPLVPNPATDGLRVMTWNLLGAQADDLLFSEHAGWAARVDQLAPDVLILQEAQAEDVAAIRTRTTTDYRVASYRRWGCDIKPNREGVAILVTAALDVGATGGTQVGTSCLNPTLGRVLVWADIELPGGPLRVYGTHLTAGDGVAAASRDGQIRRIKELIAEHDPGDERRWLLTGDLNTAPLEPSYRLLTGANPSEPGPYPFVDTYAEISAESADPSVCPVVDPDDTVGMDALFADPEQVLRCGYTAGWPKDDNLLGCDLFSLCISWQTRRDSSVRMRIDMVLRADGSPITPVRGLVPTRADPDWGSPNAEWYRLSDHLPYVVDLLVD